MPISDANSNPKTLITRSIPLQTIQRLNIIPFNNSDIKAKVNQFGQLSEEVRRNIPEVLMATMNILYSQYHEIK